MKKNNFSIYFIILIGIFITANFFCQDKKEKKDTQGPESDIIQLPLPNYKSSTSIEEALLERRSVRDYSSKPLFLAEVSQILWAAQGTDKESRSRTAPSAGALYPLEVYLAAANVEDLAAGIYKYSPWDHTLKKITEGDKRAEISNAALKQRSILEASAVIVIAAVYERTSVKYGKRTERYVNMEVGHVGQNIYLQAVSLGISTVLVGAFEDEALKKAVNLSANEFPLAIYPLGKI